MPLGGVGYYVSWLRQYLGYCQGFKFSTVCFLTFSLFICCVWCCLLLSFSASVRSRITDEQEALSVGCLTSLSMNGGVRNSLPSTRCMPTVVVLSRRLQLVDWMLIPVGVSSYFLTFSFCMLHTYACLSNVCVLPFAEMEVARQRVLVRASAAARK